jgi:hypothetical protein
MKLRAHFTYLGIKLGDLAVAELREDAQVLERRNVSLGIAPS